MAQGRIDTSTKPHSRLPASRRRRRSRCRWPGSPPSPGPAAPRGSRPKGFAACGAIRHGPPPGTPDESLMIRPHPLAALGPVEDDPDGQVVGEVIEAVLDARRHEKQVARAEAVPAGPLTNQPSPRTTTYTSSRRCGVWASTPGGRTTRRSGSRARGRGRRACRRASGACPSSRESRRGSRPSSPSWSYSRPVDADLRSSVQADQTFSPTATRRPSRTSISIGVPGGSPRRYFPDAEPPIRSDPIPRA